MSDFYGEKEGGTRMWCPGCKRMEKCKSVPLSTLHLRRRVRYSGYEDMYLFQRLRECSYCSNLFVTAEACGELMQELYDRRRKDVRVGQEVTVVHPVEPAEASLPPVSQGVVCTVRSVLNGVVMLLPHNSGHEVLTQTSNIRPLPQGSKSTTSDERNTNQSST